MTDREDDDENRQCVESAFDMIQLFIDVGRNHMQPGGRADVVNLALRSIEVTAQQAQGSPWPDPKARALAAAKQDKTLQKLVKKASRKALI
ncbi:MAG: hypothetical protein KIT63_23770 [Rhodoferax sp.]|nr:hypothetical protein [Rhodoferax sp.]